MNQVLERISKIGIVPVVKINDAENAEPLAQALCNGGITCVEITFRTGQAEEAIRRILKEFPHMLVGAGAVLTVENVKTAVAAGASFIVSPGLNPEVVGYCAKNGITVVPGCSNPSDIEKALSFGLETVKYFPAEALGGIGMIKAISAPYDNVRFMPTGGISLKNLNDYLSFDKVIACGGSWMVSEELISSGFFEKITDLAREAVDSVLGFEPGI